MGVTVHLMRHGAIRGHETRRYVGQSDVALDRLGRDQAECWKKRLSGTSFTSVYSSDLSRAAETARIVAGMEPCTVPELRELDTGQWEGVSVERIRKAHPEEFEARGRDVAGFRIPGGESFEDLARRAFPAFGDILEGSQGDVLVVAHSGVNRVVICRLLGMPLEHMFRFGQDYCCLNLISMRRGSPFLQALNLPCL